MQNGKILSLEDRVPKIKEYRKKKANRRLIFLLSIFFTLIVLLVYFQSPLSHIKEINVNGQQLLTEEEIVASSGLVIGENIWKINKSEVEERLQQLAEIQDVQVELEFPNLINIKVEEYKSIALFSIDMNYYPLLENGIVLEKESRVLSNSPILVNFNNNKVLEELAKQLTQIPAGILNSISEIHYDPKETDEYHIYMFMNDGYEVMATIPTLAEKIIHYPSIIAQLDPEHKGIIDFEVGAFFRAYDLESEGEKESEEDEG